MQARILGCAIGALVLSTAALTGCGGAPTERADPIVLEPEDATATGAHALTEAADVLAARLAEVDAGAEVEVQDGHIEVSLGPDGDVDERVLTDVADLTVRPVTHGESVTVACEDASASQPCRAREPLGEELVFGAAQLDGAGVEKATAESVPEVGWTVLIGFTAEGAEVIADLTADLACSSGGRLGLLVDGRVASAPVIFVPCGEQLSDAIQISGGLDEAEAVTLAAQLSGGPLPMRLAVAR